MKVIHNQEELLDFVGSAINPYDVDEHWVIHEVDYTYPIVLEFVGDTHLGEAYKARSFDELKEVFAEIMKEEQ